MHQFSKAKLSSKRNVSVILQTEASECALACLAMVATYHGHETNVTELRKRHPVSLKGLTLVHVAKIADQLGMTARALRLELEEIVQLNTPCILHWNMNHFMVLVAVENNSVVVHDPSAGRRRLTMSEMSNGFTGVALELTPNVRFQRKRPPSAIALRDLVGKVIGLKRGLAQLFILAIVLEVFSLVPPILTQWIMDEAVVAGDRDLLLLLCSGVVAIGISSALISAVRSWIGIYLSTNFGMQWMSSVMSRLLRLPVSYFERRHVGDIVSRFNSVKTIEQTITSSAIEVFLDGLLVIGTLGMMLLYSPPLAAVSVAAMVLYALLRWIRYDAERAAAAGLIVKEAKEQTFFLETIRGARSIKLANRESERRSAWLNHWVDATNISLSTQKLGLFFGAVLSLITTFERALILWIGALATIDAKLSIGMFFAFLSYKEQFSGRVTRMIERIVEISMLSVSTERLADIVLSEPEEADSFTARIALPDDLTLVLQNVGFRYLQDATGVLNGVNLSIREGECLAIVGPSGAGKTTLMKLLLGVLSPNAGKVLIGNVPLTAVGLRAYRDVVATVMQDDQLFAGSILDNICFLDPKPDFEFAYEAAKLAQIHDDVLRMPMGYHTLVGDMGTVLSGGQKQRVLLARALYRKPRILFLDEATSHLDLHNEAKIGLALSGLQITRVMIAHRPQTLAIADRIIKVERGELVEVHRPVCATES